MSGQVTEPDMHILPRETWRWESGGGRNQHSSHNALYMTNEAFFTPTGEQPV